MASIESGSIIVSDAKSDQERKADNDDYDEDDDDHMIHASTGAIAKTKIERTIIVGNLEVIGN